MTTFKKLAALLIAGVMVTAMGSGVLAIDVAAGVLTDAETITRLQEVFESQKVGEIVPLDGDLYRILTRTLTIDEENPANSTINTQYSKAATGRGITSEWSHIENHTYLNGHGRTVSATLYATFEYDNVNAPKVYRSYYTFSDYSAFDFVSLTSSTSGTTLYHTLTYNWLVVGGLNQHNITISCGKNG